MKQDSDLSKMGPPHCAAGGRQFLDHNFLECWIARRGSILTGSYTTIFSGDISSQAMGLASLQKKC